MTRDEAIAHTTKCLEQGDETMKSKTWSGGGFKAEAVRMLLDECERSRVALTKIAGLIDSEAGEPLDDAIEIATKALQPTT